MKKPSLSQMKLHATELLCILANDRVRIMIGKDDLINYYQYIAHEQALNFPTRDAAWYIMSKNYLSQFLK